jgi:putative CocE/NonD family hydrolase
VPKEEFVFIPVSDGIRLSAKLYIPDGPGPFPAVMEALPYRKDDITNNYEAEYKRLRDEGGYVVCRLDVRGTGSSEGIAEDEYLPIEQQDLCEVIDWLATQDWSSGAVGMYGTSYSGFNSLQVAMHRPPALKAIISIFATDSRYTDDVHYGGGANRGIDRQSQIVGPRGQKVQKRPRARSFDVGERGIHVSRLEGPSHHAIVVVEVATEKIRPGAFASAAALVFEADATRPAWRRSVLSPRPGAPRQRSETSACRSAPRPPRRHGRN